MAERKLVYFVSDVHLGLRFRDPVEREARFLAFLRSLPREKTRALCLLGDIWDFWYEYRDVVPREAARVVAQLIDLMDSGVEVYFCPGNHDIWTYSYFESLGMKRFDQPGRFEFGGKTFCLGHGDLLGGAARGYEFMIRFFHNPVAQWLFSLLHPWIAFRIGNGWSNSNRRKHTPYHFRGADEPLYRFVVEQERRQHADFYVFGHFHDAVDLPIEGGSRLLIMKDWMEKGWSYALFDGSGLALHTEEE